MSSVFVIVAAWLAMTFIHRPKRPMAGNLLGNPPGMVDRLVLLDTPQAFGGGTMTHVELRDVGSPVIRLVDGPSKEYPRVGVWTSAEIQADFPFTELLPSWNVQTPPETGIRVEARVRDRRRQAWSPWLYFGSWGRVSPADGDRVVVFDRGVVNVDNLALDRPADAVQVRVWFESFTMNPAASPLLRRVGLCYSGVVKDARERARLTPPVIFDGPWARDLAVPYRTQKETPPALRPQICSPTSVSMVMAFWGVDRPTVENALAMYDADHAMFGNWNRAVARAGELGLDAWLTRFRDWDHVKAEIARGRPVIASIVFKKGEFPSAALSSTTGHLIVIRGFTPAGDPIVNDPANKTKGNNATYKANEFAHAWFDHGGVGYVIAGPAKPFISPTTAPASISR